MSMQFKIYLRQTNWFSFAVYIKRGTQKALFKSMLVCPLHLLILFFFNQIRFSYFSIYETVPRVATWNIALDTVPATCHFAAGYWHFHSLKCIFHVMHLDLLFTFQRCFHMEVFSSISALLNILIYTLSYHISVQIQHVSTYICDIHI